MAIITIKEHSNPDTPASGKGIIYVDSTAKRIALKNDQGEVIISGTEVVDNLTSTASTKALSANQGKILNDKFNTAVSGTQSDWSQADINASDFIKNKPTIPTVTNDLSDALKTQYDSAYSHSQATHAPSNAQKNSDITKPEIEAKLVGEVSSHTHASEHNHANKTVLDKVPSSVTNDKLLGSDGAGNIIWKDGGSGASVTVDSTIQDGSTNPVENNAVFDGLATKLDTSLKGANNGLAELGADGKVPTAQLPDSIDEIIEAANFAALPASGVANKIYITLDNNKTFRWSGTVYVEISASITLGETSGTAYRGDRGKIAYDHSQVAHSPSDAQKNSDITKAEIEAKLTGAITSHSHSTDHSHGNKALLDTYTQTEANLSDAVSKKHSHTNKAELDKIPASTSASNAGKVLKVTSVGDQLEWGTGSELSLGETSITAYRGDKGKIAYDHSQDVHAPSNAQKNSDITKTEIENKLTGTISTHAHADQHSHANNALLDTYTQTEVNLADAVAKKHEHSNKSELDKVPSSTTANDSGKVLKVGTGDTLEWGTASSLQLGETDTTAYRGDRGKIAYDHSQVTHAPSGAQANADITKAEIEAKLTGELTSHTHASVKGVEFKTVTDDYTTPKIYKMWEGTEAQYNAIANKDTNTRYWITDDTTSGGGATADDTAYGASWNGNQDAATKNAIYDKMEVDKISNSSQWYCYQDTGQEQTMSTTAFANNYMYYPTLENNPNNQLTIVTDANGTYTKFTPTRAGIYAVESGIDLQNATYAAGNSVQMVLAVKGVLVGRFGLQPSQAAGTYFCYIGGNQFIFLDPSLGDFVTIHTYINKTGAAAITASGKFATFMRITQLGF